MSEGNMTDVIPSNLDLSWLERAAAAEHESWSGWMRWMLSQIRKELKTQHIRPELQGKIIALIYGCPKRGQGVALPCFRRWRRQMNTAYSDLPEQEKESDRKEAIQKIATYVDTVNGIRKDSKARGTHLVGMVCHCGLVHERGSTDGRLTFEYLPDVQCPHCMEPRLRKDYCVCDPE